MQSLDTLAVDFAKLFMRMHRLLDHRMMLNGISLSRTNILLFADRRGSVRATDIADIFGLAPRTVTEALDGLERDGLVQRDPDVADRRVKRISVTDLGRQAIAKAEPLRRDLIGQIFGVLDAVECRQLTCLLAKLSDAVEEQERGD